MHITLALTIHAPLEKVFRTIADPAEYAKAVPEIVEHEILSTIRSGAGTRFRSARLMQGKRNITELEIAEYAENQRVRMVAESHGVVWDSLYSVAAAGAGCRLELVMEARTHHLLPRLMFPLMRPMLSKAMLRDLEAIKAFCERGDSG